jgi:AcrR family transcriptional regulator
MARINSNDKKEVRRLLLKKAAEEFAKKGFDKANINEISRSAGYASGTVYNYFKSKDKLFGAVVSEAARLTVERFVEARAGASARDSLRALAVADTEVLREEEAFVKVLAGEAMDPSSKDYKLIIAGLGPFINTVSKILKQGQKNGEIRKDKPVEQLSLFFLGLLTLLYIQHWKSLTGWPKIKEIPDLAVTLFLDGAGRAVPKKHT